MSLDEIRSKLQDVELQDQWGNVYEITDVDEVLRDFCPIYVDIVNINDREIMVSHNSDPSSRLEHWEGSYIWMCEHFACQGDAMQKLKVVTFDNLKPTNPDVSIDEALIALTDMLPHNDSEMSWLESHMQAENLTAKELEERAKTDRKYAMWWNRYQKYHKPDKTE